MSERKSCRANCFDSSALVKLHTNENGSEVVRSYFANEATNYATPFCFYEALGVLKVKWMYRKEITKEQYLKAAFSLTTWFGATTRRINDVNFQSPMIIKEVHRLVDETSLDLSDVFQIISVKQGFFSRMVGDSKTILVTGDKNLAAVAKKEGIRTWYFLEEAEP